MPNVSYEAKRAVIPAGTAGVTVTFGFSPKAVFLFSLNPASATYVTLNIGCVVPTLSRTIATDLEVALSGNPNAFAYHSANALYLRQVGGTPSQVPGVLSGATLTLTPSVALVDAHSVIALAVGGVDPLVDLQAGEYTTGTPSFATGFSGLASGVIQACGPNVADNTLAAGIGTLFGAFDGTNYGAVGTITPNDAPSGSRGLRTGLFNAALGGPISSSRFWLTPSGATYPRLITLNSGSYSVRQTTFAARGWTFAIQGIRIRVEHFTAPASGDVLAFGSAPFRPGAAIVMFADQTLAADINAESPSYRPGNVIYGVTDGREAHCLGYLRNDDGAGTWTTRTVDRSGALAVSTDYDGGTSWSDDGELTVPSFSWSGKLQAPVAAPFSDLSRGVAILFEAADQTEASPHFLNTLRNRP